MKKLAEILQTTPALLMDWVEKSIDIKSQLTKKEQSLLYKYNSVELCGN